MSFNLSNGSMDTKSLEDRKPLLDSARSISSEQRSRERTSSDFCSSCSFAAVAFAFATVTGQVIQYVSMPLWIDSTSHTRSSSTNRTIKWRPRLDSYFVLSFASFAFVIVFGFAILLCIWFYPKYPVATRWSYRRFLMMVGFFQGISALFIVFSSSGKRTPPYLQSILGNVIIPFTMLFRFLFLKKIPTRRKCISAAAVFLGLFTSLIPTIFPGIDSQRVANRDLGGATGPGKILWPLAFMLSFVIGSISFIMEEKAVKMGGEHVHAQASIMSVLFWTSLAQFLCAVLCFWADIIPGFGYTNNIQEFIQNWMFGLQCVFGGAGCSWTPGGLAFLFIAGYVMYICGAALLLRYAEGATLLAIVMALSTPLGFIFWMLFEEKPFCWNPTFHRSSWFTIGALLIMIPASFIYNTGMPEREAGREEINSTEP